MSVSARARAGIGSILAVLFVFAAATSCRKRSAAAPPAPRASGVAASKAAAGGAGMEKYVSKQAAFVLYKPTGWVVAEAVQSGFQLLSVVDPKGTLEAAMAYGKSPTSDDVQALAGMFARAIAQRYPDIHIAAAKLSNDRRRVVFDALFNAPGKGRRERRCWVSGVRGEFVYSSIEAPQGQLAASKRLLLSILGNVRVIKEVSRGGERAPVPVAMASYRLRDGSASFLMPVGWRCQELGAGAFVAGDPNGTHSFMVGSVDMLTPALGVSYRGAIVSPYLSPSRAWQFITEHMGLASGMQFESVIPRPDMASQIARVYTSGPVQVEELVYTCNAKNQRSKGYTIGYSFGSRLNTNWNFRHFSVVAPAADFNAFLINFITMLQSYRINEAWAQQYVAQGLQRLRQLQQQTSALIARNAEEIHSMMQAAYDERQRSQDYIDYQRTSYIRGEQDWISSVEGGSVYHSDSWGTKNATTGEFWEGQPYNYVNFEGKNPKYDEQMQAIDNRALFEKYRH